MVRSSLLVCLLVVTVACGPVSSTIPSAPSPPLASSGVMNFVGQEVKIYLEHNDFQQWEFTAGGDGTMTVTVNWTAPGTVALRLDDELSSQSNKPPIVGRAQVAVGQRVRVRVEQPAAGPNQSGEGWSLPITVSTALEY
jgi:hypothetical protein